MRASFSFAGSLSFFVKPFFFVKDWGGHPAEFRVLPSGSAGYAVKLQPDSTDGNQVFYFFDKNNDLFFFP
jgi:hypothetical protein